jgi:subtilisin family serine protease
MANAEAVMTGTARHYSAGTVEHGARESTLFAAGKKSGHGTIAWLPAPSYEMPASPPWRPSRRPPVIALLDTGVREHRWLPPGNGHQPFVLLAEALGWPSPVPGDDAAPAREEEDPDYRSHWGHATFIAGLIRRAAPGAQVLSMRVMDRDGKVSEDVAASALSWLADNPAPAGGIDVDIVLMAFGRQEDPGDRDLEKLRAPIKKLGGRGVRVVASAGNDGAERPVYPAAFAADPGLSCEGQRSVLSVGALATPTGRAPYSNSGPWVTHWHGGTNIISIMPLTAKSREDHAPGFDHAAAPAPGNGYAWWSGTSFAAAIAAGELAARLPGGRGFPEPAAGS